MKENRIKRFLALVLAASMILSDAPVAVFALEEEKQPVSCDVNGHIHTDECYAAVSLTETEPVEETEAAEETVAIAETEAAEVMEEIQETEAAEETVVIEVIEEVEETEVIEVVEEVEIIEVVDEVANAAAVASELTLMDRLMAAQDLQALQEQILSEAEAMAALSLGEISAVKTHAQTLFDALETPTGEEQGYYARIMEVLNARLEDQVPVMEATPVSGNLPGGNIPADTQWRLEDDGNLRENLTILSGVTMEIDLNGFTLQMASDNQLAKVHGKLIIRDSSESKRGLITGQGKKDTYGGAICVEKSGTLEIHGGTISGFTAFRGGAIHSEGTILMTGGTISGNQAEDCGGAVNTRGVFTMTGGTIGGNTAESMNKAPNGGGITVGDGSFTLNGGTVSGNKADSDGGGIYVWRSNWAKNDPVASIVSGTVSKNTANQGGGIYSKYPVTMTGGTIFANTATSNGGGVYNENRFVLNGGTIGGSSETQGNKAASGAGIYNSGTLEMNNGSVSGNTASGSGGGVYNTNSFTISNGKVSDNWSKSHGGGIYNNKTLSMTGGTISGNRAGKIDTNKGNNGFDITDGFAIYTSNWGGGVYSTDGGSKFTMEGGIITENTAASAGGVALWSGATFDMKGGTISYNNAYGYGGPGNGGASYVNSATFNFYAGTIEHNWARRYGGAINLNEGGKLYLLGENGECIIQNNSANNGGGISQEKGQCEMAIKNDNIKIRNNTARDDNRPSADYLQSDGCGGGLFIEMGTIEITAGSISANQAMAGGGIALCAKRVDGNITVEMTGGTVSDNQATETGGGIDIHADAKQGQGSNDVVFNLSGGTFRDNETTAGTGGAVDIWVAEVKASAVMNIGETVEDGSLPVITGNKAAVNGGAIRMRSGNVYLYSGTISGNHAGQYGGGITVNGGNFEMSGGTIGGTKESDANTAGNGGGGIAIRVQEFASDITVTMNGGTIAGNRAVHTGGGMDIYADYQDENTTSSNVVAVNLNGGTFEGNRATGGTDADGKLTGTGGAIDIWVNENNSTADLYLGKGLTDTEHGPSFRCNTAATNGGAIRMRNGRVHLYKGEITENESAQNGGAISINGGDFFMYGGNVSNNRVTAGHGGAIVLNNGIVTVRGGTIMDNYAYGNGGAIAVSNGQIIMAGGEVSDNLAETGHGGAMYVAGYGGDAIVKIFSGRICNNKAPAGSGGAVAILGGTGMIFVQTGLNLLHEFSGNVPVLNEIPHNDKGEEDPGTPPEFIHTYCPVIQNNSSKVSGGAFFITGGISTRLNIYCIEEANNTTVDDADYYGVVLSNFMMVEGGQVIISSAETSEGGIDEDTSGFGNSPALGSVHVYAGELRLYGSMDNPAFTDVLTVDRRNLTDVYEDHRTSETKFKLTYNENFTDANGNPNSTIKAYDITKGEEVVTIAELLFNHPGYTIHSWNTQPDGSGTDYVVRDEYIFLTTDDEKEMYPKEDHQFYQYGDLDLYAIWEPNMFLVEFHSGVPEGEAYSGTMDGVQFTYDEPSNKLPKNQYVRPGYLFTGWSYTDDAGSLQLLQDEHHPLPNLTRVKGGTVHLYATWVECGTDEKPHEITYSAADNVLTGTCIHCHKTATITILAEDAVYDGNRHGYTVVCSDQAFLNPDIRCTAKKIDSDDPPVNLLVDAGRYTVTAESLPNSDGTKAQATLTYTISKADQRDPAVPTYTPPQGEGDGVVTIHQIADVRSPDSGEQVHYAVKYLKDGNWIYSDWKKSASTTDQSVTISVDQNLTNYYVLAQYPGNDNYNPSRIVEAGETFFFDGKITVTILRTAGIVHTAEGNDHGLELQLGLQDGYYLNDDYYYVTVTNGDAKYIIIEDRNEQTTTEYKNTSGTFAITADNTNPPAEAVSIVLTVGYATKATAIKSTVEEGQVFDTVSGSEATIARDSAYTVFFKVSDYNADIYNVPHLAFQNGIPMGTRLILINKADNSYWYYNAQDGGLDVVLTNFVRMGTEGERFSVSDKKNLHLQVIVDFSRVKADKLLPEGTFITWLDISGNSEDLGNAPVLTRCDKNPGVEVTLKDTAFHLEKDGGQGMHQRLTYRFDSGVSSSKWNYRELALILRPIGSLPADATMIAEQANGNRVQYRPVQIPDGSGTETAFLIPLDGFSNYVTLILESFTITPGDYSMSVRLVAACSVAEDAPVNGTVVDSVDTITFSASEAPVSLKVTEEDDRHLFDRGDTLKLEIQADPFTLPAGYERVVELQEKNGENTTYDFFGVYYSNDLVPDSGRYTLTKALTMSPGNYRLRFYVETDSGYCIVETYYYFIVQ